MGRMGSTTSPRARQMRRVLAGWQGSGLTLREFGEQRRIPVSTLSWWRQVFRRAGETVNARTKNAPASDAVVFTEVPPQAIVATPAPVMEIVLRSGHMLRVPRGADAETLQRVLQALQAAC
jgi:hypothetical protein